MSVDEQLRHLPLVFVDDLRSPVLAAGDLRHLQKSLRLRLGEPIAVGDGRGSWMPATLGEVAEPTGDIQTVELPETLTGVAFVPVKAERPDFIVQKLVELGVDRIVVATSERSVIKWDATRAAKQHERWHHIATEACMQSRRLHRPLIEGPIPLSAIRADGYTMVLAEPGAPILGSGIDTDSLLVCIGPEGGWTADELANRQTVGLPGTILRAETAAVAAGVLLGAKRLE